MGEENESFYDNLILESIRNNKEIPICCIENTPKTPLIGSTPYLPSENMEKVQPISVKNSLIKLEKYTDEYDQVAIKYLKEKILNEVKQKFSSSYQEDKINVELVKSLREQIENLQSEISFLGEEMKEKNTLLKMIIHLKGPPREMTLSLPIYRQCQCKNASKKTPFHEQNMPEPFQEQSTDPSKRGANKDHYTNSIPMPSFNHPTSFPINYKHDSNIMVERDGSIVCQQNSKEHKTKKQNQNHQTNNLPGSEETDKNNRKQYPANKFLQFEQELRQQRNTKQENSKGRPL